jgi:uncharacterized membrane protein YhaH (DUF805 family)
VFFWSFLTPVAAGSPPHRGDLIVIGLKTGGFSMNWYLQVLKKYAVFTGRAQRAEYWWFFLFNLLITVALIFFDMTLGTFSEDTGYGLLSGLYTLGVLLPNIGVSIRRLHDTGRSGWWLLIGLVPLIGAIVLIVFFVMDSTPGDNQHGPNPKGVVA